MHREASLIGSGVLIPRMGVELSELLVPSILQVTG